MKETRTIEITLFDSDDHGEILTEAKFELINEMDAEEFREDLCDYLNTMFRQLHDKYPNPKKKKSK